MSGRINAICSSGPNHRFSLCRNLNCKPGLFSLFLYLCTLIFMYGNSIKRYSLYR